MKTKKIKFGLINKKLSAIKKKVKSKKITINIPMELTLRIEDDEVRWTYPYFDGKPDGEMILYLEICKNKNLAKICEKLSKKYDDWVDEVMNKLKESGLNDEEAYAFFRKKYGT